MKKTAPPLPSPKGKGKKKGKPPKNSSSKSEYLISFIVFAFAFLLYANTLHHGYVLDDDVVYLKNKDVQAGFKGIPGILHHSFIYGFTGHNDQSYRPAVLTIYAIEKEFFGNNPHTGHLINVLLFALSCVLLFRMLKTLLMAFSWAIPVAWATALLFASHPVHTEAVANIKGRDDILNFLFLILSLFFILRYLDEKKKKYFFLSILCFFICLMCKEMAVTFLAIIPLTILFFRNISLKRIGVGTIAFVTAFGIYMYIRSSVLDAVTFQEKMKVVNNALAAATNESDRIATAVLILGKYLLLLFFPHPLSWDYSYNQIPIVTFSDIKVILTIFVLVALGVYAIHSLIKAARKTIGEELLGEAGNRMAKTAIYGYCILFFFITMSVVSNLFIMIGATLGERFLFVPSMAFCIAVAVTICVPSGRISHPKELRQPAGQATSQAPLVLKRGFLYSIWGDKRGSMVLLILIVLFSLKTYTRNMDWKDNLSLFMSGVEATPNSSRAESALGSSYREMGEKEQDPNKRIEFFQKAIIYYKKAIEILPNNTEALYNAGVSYYGAGDRENALKVYEQALKVSPEYVNAANNAGVIYFERKDYENAKKYFLQAIKYDPANADALGNLGAIHHNQGNFQEAIQYYKKALEINPGNQNIQNNLIKAEQALGSKRE